MVRYLIPNVEFREDHAQVISCGLYAGDRPAYNYLDLTIIDEIDQLDLTKDLSFVLLKNPSLELLGYIMVREENYNNQPKGVKIHSICYCNNEAFHCIINNLKTMLAWKIDNNGEYEYDYLWGYEFEDYSLIEDEFFINKRDNIFIARLH